MANNLYLFADCFFFALSHIFDTQNWIWQHHGWVDLPSTTICQTGHIYVCANICCQCCQWQLLVMHNISASICIVK